MPTEHGTVASSARVHRGRTCGTIKIQASINKSRVWSTCADCGAVVHLLLSCESYIAVCWLFEPAVQFR